MYLHVHTVSIAGLSKAWARVMGYAPSRQITDPDRGTKKSLLARYLHSFSWISETAQFFFRLVFFNSLVLSPTTRWFIWRQSREACLLVSRYGGEYGPFCGSNLFCCATSVK